MTWEYYNYAIIPKCAPHEIPDINTITSGRIWEVSKKALLVRWTTDFDCREKTNWWYVIKDTPFDISELKSKRRYEIRKGEKNFEVRRLNTPEEYAEALYDVQVAAFSAYPPKYRPTVDRDDFIKSIGEWKKEEIYVYGAFSRHNSKLCGYAYLTEGHTFLSFNVLKSCPCYEKQGVNAAIIYKILQDFKYELEGDYYICDGSRSISHETSFQDYLEKYFGFRKAYCKLCIKYNPKVQSLILLLYKFRRIFKKLDYFGIIHKMNGVFLMQEIIEEGEN